MCACLEIRPLCSRSLDVLIAALQEFGSLGVDFISYTQNIDTTTPMGRLFFHVIGSFAAFERELIIEPVHAGLAKARAKSTIPAEPLLDLMIHLNLEAIHFFCSRIFLIQVPGLFFAFKSSREKV